MVVLNVENVKRVVDTFESATETIEVMEEVVDHAMTKVRSEAYPVKRAKYQARIRSFSALVNS